MSKAKEIMTVLEDALLLNVSVYETADKSPFFDYVIVGTAKNERQLSASLEKFREKEIPYDHVEGKGSSGWILVDAGDVLVNLMTAEKRSLFGLDDLYGRLD